MSDQLTGLHSFGGVVIKGGQVASGQAANSPFPAGTIELQKPFFKQRGLDLSRFHPATINVSIKPLSFQLVSPKYTFRNVHWLEGLSAEHFSFAELLFGFKGVLTEGLLYYPHPETKLGFEKDSSVLEVLVPYIPGISYGERVELSFPPEQVQVVPNQNQT